MNICFTCENEWIMYETRDMLALVLRRARIRYRTDRCYPKSCYKFSRYIDDDPNYYMVFLVELEPDNPAYEMVIQAAKDVVEHVKGVSHLDIS